MTEEQKKEKSREAVRRYREKHREEINAKAREHQRIYREENKDKVRESGKKYYEKNKEAVLSRVKKYTEKNKEKIKKRQKDYYEANKDEILENRKEYYKNNVDKEREYREKNSEKIRENHRKYVETKKGRASHLATGYRYIDRNRDFDTSNNVTTEWIEENIFSGQKCIYCGDSDWTHLGCDRIDNSKPHTPENCVPCCRICNIEKKDRYTVEQFKEYRKLNPRTLGTGIEKSWEITELPSGTKVIKKKSIPASA